MSDLIVWDEDNKKMYDVIEINYEGFDNSLRYVKGNNGKRMYVGHDKFTLHKYIGKTDDTPEKNKIYTDSSIVEYSEGFRNFRGYFQYSNDLSCYRIINNHGVAVSPYLTENLKVIGSLQENSDLL